MKRPQCTPHQAEWKRKGKHLSQEWLPLNLGNAKSRLETPVVLARLWQSYNIPLAQKRIKWTLLAITVEKLKTEKMNGVQSEGQPGHPENAQLIRESHRLATSCQNHMTIIPLISPCHTLAISISRIEAAILYIVCQDLRSTRTSPKSLKCFGAFDATYCIRGTSIYIKEEFDQSSAYWNHPFRTSDSPDREHLAKLPLDDSLSFHLSRCRKIKRNILIYP